jgi:hypothetical protein
MKILMILFMVLVSYSAVAQHHHHADTTKQAVKKSSVKKKSPPKKPVSKPGTVKKTSEKKAVSTHQHPADTTKRIHDLHHDTNRDTTTHVHHHMADTMRRQTGDTIKHSHTHQLDDSTIIIHDANHNEIRDTGHVHHQGSDSMPANHHNADTMQRHKGHNTTDTSHATHSEHTSGMDHGSMSMSHAYSINLSMNRNGSGTSWLPDASPMYGYMFHTAKWMYMLHGNLFLRYNKQDIGNKGSRGDEMSDVPNWLMLMGQRRAGAKGLLHFSTMFSLDALVAGGKGYPLLFQSGETYNGKPLVDRQHPHDLFSELSVSYSYAFSKNTDLFAYLAFPGEPALGPVAFMHRPSALPNPDAPISHHWVDATHITFGVATLGLRSGKFKIEASSFTGREPDENRYNFDEPRFDSWSGRLSWQPTTNLSIQVSQGFINSPEAAHPGENIQRSSASAIYSCSIGRGYFNACALWGMNKVKDHKGEHAALAEASWSINKLTLHTRYEYVQKSVEELVLNEMVYGPDAVFPVNAVTMGLNYDLFSVGKTRIAGGSQFTWYHADKRLDNLYGANPMAVEMYLRLYPSLMGHSAK